MLNFMKSIVFSAVLAPSVNAMVDFGMDDFESYGMDPQSDDCWPDEDPTEDDQCFRGDVSTDLDFSKARVGENQLHKGGVLQYKKVGQVNGQDIDLVVSVQPGTTYSSKKGGKRNGKKGDFGQINLFTIKKNLESGQGNFRFCWMKSGSKTETVKVPSFRWTVYDVDERNAAVDGIKEKLIMDTSQAKDIFLWPNLSETEIQGWCESGVPPPCSPGDRMIFHSSTKGTGGDNPDDMSDLSDTQKKRSIVFYFEDTDCWDFTYEHYCQIEEDKGQECTWYGGGNFMFAGDSKEIIKDGSCVPTKDNDHTGPPSSTPTKAITGSPSARPTVSPTPEPTGGPTSKPSATPTAEPTGGPTSEPSATPTVEPTGAPTSEPSATPTVEPTGGPSEEPTLTSTSSPTESPKVPDCLGKTNMQTELDFFNSKVTTNTLHKGGVMKFEGIGIVRDRPVDLIVSVVPGTTYESAKGDLQNGKNEKFGKINLYTDYGDLESGQGNFRFCFHDHATQKKTKVDSFLWSVYDVDERNDLPNGIKEKMIMDVSKVQDYMLWPNAEGSEIKLSCEDSGLPPPCADGERTVFHSSTKGTGEDNPSDPNDMTAGQKERSIVFSFKDTDCWDFTYEHYCKLEEETGEKCSWYGGGNFLFAGNAQEIVEGGECLTPAPTEEPKPTFAPTVAPTPRTDRTFLPPDCPSDVKVLKTIGVTEFPPVDERSTVRVVSKNVEDNTVTVALNQFWPADSIGSIYYQWQSDFFKEQCLQVTDVAKGYEYAEITIQCSVLKPITKTTICLAEPRGEGFLQPEDNATIPKCCGEAEGAAVVCYTVEIQCTPGCADQDAQEKVRRLRGTNY